MEQGVQASDSPFLAHLGIRIEEWLDGEARIGLVLQPHHLNRSGVVQGGLLATLLDHVAGLSGLFCPVPGHKRYGTTLSLTTNFVGQSRAGHLVAIGQRTGGGRKIFFATGQVRTDAGELLATATGVFRYRSGSEAPEGVPTPPAPRV